MQALGPVSALRARIDAELAAHGAADLLAQRECADAGVNVGFLVARPSPRLAAFARRWRAEVLATGALDQKILDRIALAGDDPVAVRRLPAAFWASSHVAPPDLEALVLHHANFVLDEARRPATDPAPKLAQLDLVRACRERGDRAAFAAFVGAVRGDASLARYRARHFPPAAVDAWAARERAAAAAPGAAR